MFSMNEYISDICDILDIDVPTISYDTSNFPTKTTMAQCDLEEKTIFLRKLSSPTPDQLFAIAHEIRHIWQAESNPAYFFSNYKPIHLCKNHEEYNLQEAELDANAFGSFVMIDFFGMRPLFEGIPVTVKEKIFKRAEFFASVFE